MTRFGAVAKVPLSNLPATGPYHSRADKPNFDTVLSPLFSVGFGRVLLRENWLTSRRPRRAGGMPFRAGRCQFHVFNGDRRQTVSPVNCLLLTGPPSADECIIWSSAPNGLLTLSSSETIAAVSLA
jgi:hypothetical protein